MDLGKGRGEVVPGCLLPNKIALRAARLKCIDNRDQYTTILARFVFERKKSVLTLE